MAKKLRNNCVVASNGPCEDWGQLPSKAASISLPSDLVAGTVGCFSEASSLKLNKGRTKSGRNVLNEHKRRVYTRGPQTF